MSKDRTPSLLLKPLSVALAAAGLALLLPIPAAVGNTGAAASSTAAQASAKKPPVHHTVTKPKRVHTAPKPKYPHSFTLTNDKIAHWAPVLTAAPVRSKPSLTAHVTTTLDTTTTDGTSNLVLVLTGIDVSSNQTWYRVRLPILPNNSTGWVRAGYLGDLYTVHTHLYVNRSTLRATLKRDGKTIFTTVVGVGHSYWPTPAGQFYIRDKLIGFDDPVYGPVAFGTSARSAVLTDWPGGGFVGVHGTNEPQILPGYVSHGCIRMPNESIMRLAQLLQVGSPLTVT